MKKGLKRILLIVGILLVVALIGFGIYWLVTHNNNLALANTGFEGGRHGSNFEGMRPSDDFADRAGWDRINPAFGWFSLGRILLEIVLVTLGVLGVQWLIRKLRKPKAPAEMMAKGAPIIGQPVEISSTEQDLYGGSETESQDLFPPASQEPEKSE